MRKSQTSLRLSPLHFSFAAGYSHFLGRKIQHLKSALNSAAPAPLLAPAPLPVWARAHAYETQHLHNYSSRDFFFPPALLNTAILVAARQAGKADQQKEAHKFMYGLRQPVQVVGRVPSASAALGCVNVVVLVSRLLVGCCALGTQPHCRSSVRCPPLCILQGSPVKQERQGETGQITQARNPYYRFFGALA